MRVIGIKALIIFHGLCDSKKQMLIILSKISKYYDTVICDDLPGHGKNKSEFNKENSINFVLSEYDKVKNYKEIDVLGYSLGGVLSVFLQSVRRIDNLYLLAPAIYYIFPGNLKHFKHKKINNKMNSILTNNKFLYFVEFVKIVSYVKNEVSLVVPNTYLFIGEDDYLVSYKSVKVLFDICVSKNKSIVTIPATSHTSILYSEKAISNLEEFIKNK